MKYNAFKQRQRLNNNQYRFFYQSIIEYGATAERAYKRSGHKTLLMSLMVRRLAEF